MFEIYSASEEKTYRTHICTKATIFIIIFNAAIFLGPFFVLIYNQEYFLDVPVLSHIEQPKVQFKQQYYGVFSTADTIIVCTSYENIRLLYLDHYRQCSIKSSELDQNNDQKYEYLILEVSVPLGSSEHLKDVNLLLVFDYRLSDIVRLQMESMVTLHEDVMENSMILTMAGSLATNQKEELFNSGRDYRYNDSVIMSNNTYAEQYDIAYIQQLYQQRNLTTQLRNIKVSQLPSTRLPMSGHTFVLRAVISYPHQLLYYEYRWWDKLLHLFIVYICLLMPTYLVGLYIKRFVFNEDILPTFRQRPLLNNEKKCS